MAQARQSLLRPGLGPSRSTCLQTQSLHRHLLGRMGRQSGAKVPVRLYISSVFISFLIREPACSSDKVSSFFQFCAQIVLQVGQ